MSLRFDLSNVKDYRSYCCTGDEVKQLTQAIIMSMPVLYMGEITDKNWNEFYKRINILQNICGSLLSDKSSINENDIRNHIGLVTNVKNESFAKFKRAMEQCAYDKLVCVK